MTQLDEQTAADYERKLDLLRAELAFTKEELDKANEQNEHMLDVAHRVAIGAMKAVLHAVNSSSLNTERQLVYFEVDAMVREALVGDVDAVGAYETWLDEYNLSGTGW